MFYVCVVSDLILDWCSSLPSFSPGSTLQRIIIVTMKDLSEWFNERLMSLTRDYDEIILVFDKVLNVSKTRMISS